MNILKSRKGTYNVIFAGKSSTMRVLFFLSVLSFLASCAGSAPESTPQTTKDIPLKTVSLDAATTAELSSLLSAYEGLRDGLVEYDSVQVDTLAIQLSARLEGISFARLSDSAVSNRLTAHLKDMATATASVPAEKTLEGKKRRFSDLSNAFYALLQQAEFDQSVVYRQTCPMAFNDNEAASWVSRSAEIMNPYLGRKHPKYASGMLHCGEITDSVRFIK
jgi:hypothetical protein